MYKYKKTIIINNRRRRIFSKEKSNTEYILYKNEYITLNAYNKKTGGSLLSNIGLRMVGEKNEFEIPKKIIHTCSIFDKDKDEVANYLKSDIIGISKYDIETSTIISDYLKLKLKIANDTDKQYWMITEYMKDNNNMKVHGYTRKEWFIQSQINFLMEYSEVKHNYYFLRYCTKEKIKLTIDNIKEYYSHFTNYYSLIYNKKIFFINDAYLGDEDLYKEIENQNYTLFYILEHDKPSLNSYKHNYYYELNGYFFQCYIMPNKLYNNYDITFRYIKDYVKLKDIFDKTEKKIVEYGKINNLIKIAKYGKGESSNFYNNYLQIDKPYNADKYLYFYLGYITPEDSSYYAATLYQKLIKEGYYIYYILEDLNSQNVDNPVYIANKGDDKIYTINKYYIITNSNIFKCTNIIKTSEEKYTIIFKLVDDYK